jgi:carbon monoxide dehydrogenase subunit G
MIALLAIQLFWMLEAPFIADASAETRFLVRQPESEVTAALKDIQVLRRNMPGVVAVATYGDSAWLYETERRMPFSEKVRTDFVLTRSGGPAVTYRTPGVSVANWMSFRFETTPVGADQTLLDIRLRVRLVRDNGREIHLFAPLLGEDFISARMHDDLVDMLERFAENFIRECETSRRAMTADGELR